MKQLIQYTKGGVQMKKDTSFMIERMFILGLGTLFVLIMKDKIAESSIWIQSIALIVCGLEIILSFDSFFSQVDVRIKKVRK